MKKRLFTRLLSTVLVICMMLAAFVGCTNETPDESKPDSTPQSSPSESSPTESLPSESSPTESSPVESNPNESTPDELVDYSITYDLDGGIDGGNPTTYNKDSEFYLKIPYKPGHTFLGWSENGCEAELNFKIEKGTEGDKTFRANWKANSDDSTAPELDSTYFGQDDGVAENPSGNPVSTHDMVGSRGEGIYVVKTVYTDIVSDGIKDAAYSYGVHWYGNVPNNNAKEYYAGRGTGYDIYMIRGQEGRLHVFIEVCDPEVVATKELWSHKTYHTDSMDVYFDLGNWGATSGIYGVVADETHTLQYGLTGTRRRPDDWQAVITEKGYNIEFSFDNDGMYFDQNDEVGLGFYLNDANEYKGINSYKKYTLRNATLTHPAEMGYFDPDPLKHDVVKFSLASATGKVDINDAKPEKTGDAVADLLSGASAGVIIIDEKATAQSIILAQNISRYLRICGADITYSYEDAIAEDASYDFEILIGNTGRELTLKTLNSANYNDVVFAFEDNKIALIGWNESGAADAEKVFVSLMEYVKNGGKSESIGSMYKYALDGMVGEDIPRLEGFDSVTDVGEGAFMVYKLQGTMDEYTAYIAKLEAAGYKKHTDNQMNRVVVSTYYNDDTVVNVQFANGDTNDSESDRSIRIIVEPLANTTLPMLEAPEDATAEVTVSSITQLVPQNLCLVIQLSNGHFIIVDSGENGTQKVLSDFLRSKAPDKNKVIIDAWFFTHFHQDHIGGFVDYSGVSSLMRYVTIKNIIYNFPQKQVLSTASGATDRANIKKWASCLEKTGATVYQARTGQKYYFGNAEIEILFTFEDIMPLNVFTDSTNRTCIGFSVTIAGQKIMVTGDATEEEFRAAARMYGDYLKSDILQIAHHGYGNGMGEHDFYKLVNAPVVLHPQKDASYPTVGPNEKWAIENAVLVIRGGNYGIATLKLPFTVGDEIESDKTPTDETPNSVTE